MMKTIQFLSVPVLAVLVVGQVSAADPSAKLFAERFADTVKALGSGKVPAKEVERRLGDLSAAAKATDIPLLALKLAETSDGEPSAEAKVAARVLARLAAKHDEARDAVVKAACKGGRHALVAIGHMGPELARKAARTLLTSDALPARTRGATLLAIMGREKDRELLRKALKEKVPDLLASVYRNAAAELEHKIKKATTEQLPQWERSGLVYWRICLTMNPGPRMATQSWWLAGKDVATGKQGRVPTELLRWKVAHREPLAVSLAGHQQEEELIRELEKLGHHRGGVGLLAKWSLATIASEEAVNACLRITATPKEEEFQHMELAKFAAKNGGPTTLGILKVLAEDKRFPEKMRKLYADAAERLSNRLESPATKPTTEPTRNRW